jgi:mannose-1-phosphate guanylyltransferase / mannose-6-phosphate isomerase
MAMFIPIILSGGAGTRLWPVSREALPKPFIKLPDGESLLLKTMRRALACANGAGVLTITNKDYFFLTRDEYACLGTRTSDQDFLLEPVSRNTAPAIGAAAVHVARQYGEDAVMLVLPADHLIVDTRRFIDAVNKAAQLAEQGWLVTFGITPSRPETGFGYIEAGKALSVDCSAVKRFVEKPDAATAERYIAAGSYSWNSGMFCFAAGTVLKAMHKYAPEVARAMESTIAKTDYNRTPRVLAEGEFVACPDISFDYAVMEKAEKTAVVRAAFDWSDIGSWTALADLTPADQANNRVNGEAVLVDAVGCFVQSKDRIVAAVGVEDLVIVDTADALLVSTRERAQDVKAVVQRLKLTSHNSVRHHRTVHRPWGTYTVLEGGDRFQIKRIVVKPGASLSLQMHHHRSEHWVVVAGMAKIVNGDKEMFVGPDQSTYIPAGTVHRLINPGVIDCVLIEVQTGDYLGEDDIVRLEDRYGRTDRATEGAGKTAAAAANPKGQAVAKSTTAR